MSKWFASIWVFLIFSCSAHANNEVQPAAAGDSRVFLDNYAASLGELVYKNFQNKPKRSVPKGNKHYYEFSIPQPQGYAAPSGELADEIMNMAKQGLNKVDQKYDIEIYRRTIKREAEREPSHPEHEYTICYWDIDLVANPGAAPYCMSGFLLGFSDKQSSELIKFLLKKTETANEKLSEKNT